MLRLRPCPSTLLVFVARRCFCTSGSWLLALSDPCPSTLLVFVAWLRSTVALLRFSIRMLRVALRAPACRSYSSSWLVLAFRRRCYAPHWNVAVGFQRLCPSALPVFVAWLRSEVALLSFSIRMLRVALSVSARRRYSSLQPSVTSWRPICCVFSASLLGGASQQPHAVSLLGVAPRHAGSASLLGVPPRGAARYRCLLSIATRFCSGRGSTHTCTRVPHLCTAQMPRDSRTSQRAAAAAAAMSSLPAAASSVPRRRTEQPVKTTQTLLRSRAPARRAVSKVSVRKQFSSPTLRSS